MHRPLPMIDTTGCGTDLDFYVVCICVGYFLFGLGVVCEHQACQTSRNGAYESGISSKVVSCKGLFACGALCVFGKYFEQWIDALDLVRGNKR